MIFQHRRKLVGARLPSETQQMREWTNKSKQTNRIHNAFCLHYGQRSIVSHHLIRPQTWWEVMDIESNELAAVEDSMERGFASSTQHIHLRFGVSLVRHLYENQEEFPGMLTGWFVEYLCQALKWNLAVSTMTPSISKITAKDVSNFLWEGLSFILQKYNFKRTL